MLNHPADLAAWRRWQERRHPLRALRGRVRTGPPAGVLARGGPEADLLVVLDSTSPSNRAALLAPLRHLDPARVLVLSPDGLGELLPGPWTERPWAGEPLPPVAAVLTAGHHLPLGAAAHAHADRTGAAAYVVQHGLLTPANPPLPARATLLAWTDADAGFWRAGRPDVAAHVVGSQLLHEAAARPAVPDPAAPTTYLGQLHAAELPRRRLAAAAERFCRAHDAVYRPHPSERDRRSRRTHARWEAEGMRIDRSGTSIADLRGPVVGVFSTGVLEAAVRGLPAGVDYPDPPEWLRAFWRRYGMRPLTDPAPAPAPDRGGPEPAALVADVLGAHR